MVKIRSEAREGSALDATLLRGKYAYTRYAITFEARGARSKPKGPSASERSE